MYWHVLYRGCLMESSWPMNSSPNEDLTLCTTTSVSAQIYWPCCNYKQRCTWGMCFELQVTQMSSSAWVTMPKLTVCVLLSMLRHGFLICPCYRLISALRIVWRQWRCIWETLWCSCESPFLFLFSPFLTTQNRVVIRGLLWIVL